MFPTFVFCFLRARISPFFPTLFSLLAAQLRVEESTAVLSLRHEESDLQNPNLDSFPRCASGMRERERVRACAPTCGSALLGFAK